MASLLVGAVPMSSSLSLPLHQSLRRSSSLSTSLSSTAPTIPLIYCGRGDKKTAKGKRFNHSFGNARPRDKKKGRGPPKVPVPPSPPPRNDRYDDDEVVKIEIDESLE